jgi:hypothetical protein
MTVTNDVLFHIPARRILQDVVTCIRHGCNPAFPRWPVDLATVVKE